MVSSQVFGIHAYWIGGTSGSWSEKANWSGNAVPNTANYFVHITNEVPVTISVAGATVGRIAFSGENHTISSGTIYIRTGETGDPCVEVAEGLTATMPTLYPETDGQNGLYKRGKGTLVTTSFLGHSTRHFTFLDIEEGDIRHSSSSGDSVNVGGVMRIKSGAKFTGVNANPLQNNTVVDLEAGAVYDGNNQRDTLGGFTGAGTVTNLATSSATSLTAGPLVFSGDLHGKIEIKPTAGTVVGEDGGYLRIGSVNALADADVQISGDTAYTNVLRFAAGVGTFNVKMLAFNRAIPVVLEDVNGDPIRLAAGLVADTDAAYFTGRGDYAKANSDYYMLKGDNFTASGKLVVQAGTVKAGDATSAVNDATGFQNNASGLEVCSGKTFIMQNYADTVWSGDIKVSGDGKIHLGGPGSWTIGDFSANGASLEILSGASGKVLTLAGGSSQVSGYSIGPDNFQTVITGGTHIFAGTLDCKKNHTYLQSGGYVECLLQSLNTQCVNDVFYTMTGGHMKSWATVAKGNYPQGIGLDLSGNAVAELRNEGSWYHRLCSGGKAHTICLRDNAYLGIDVLQLGEINCDATGTIRLDGGVMAVSKWIGCPSGMTDDSPLYVNIHFNGGVLRGDSLGNQSWSTYADKDRITGKVQAGGAKIDVPRTSVSFGVTLSWPFVSDVAGGTDGGLLKTGFGVLTLNKKCDVSGPVDVAAGQLVSTCSTAGEYAVGRGDITIRGADLTLQGGVAVPLCSTADATLTYTNCATLTVKDSAVVTIGAAGAAEDSVLRRGGHGVLTVSAGSDNKRLNASSTVTVNGGLAFDAVTGLPKAPIYERCWLTGNNSLTKRRHRFLKVDNNVLVPVTAVAFNPSTSTSSTVAEITSSTVTVSEDAAVGALDVEYLSGSTGKGGLTIASGKTLSIGSGEAGSVASLLLNNTWASSTGLASVEGGTISFGAAEGVILLNNDYSEDSQTKITSSITGSGGLVIAAPHASGMDAHFNGYLSLTAVNPYTGGTWIEGAVVRAEKSGCLGTGAIHVSGDRADGGALFIYGTYDSDTFANPLEFSGFGPAVSFKSPLKGALIVKRPISFTGGIALAADAKVAVSGNTLLTPVMAASAITGSGGLVLQGPGTFRLSAANTYAGGTTVESGVLEVTDAGTLGTGPVEVCEGAVLRFVNASAKTVANTITGAGMIECNGAAVTLSNASGFTGTISGAGSATGGEGYVKSGDSTVAFTNQLSYAGNTVISGGTLQLGISSAGSAPAADAIAFRLDASDTNSLTRDGTTVLAWADADGRGIAFTNIAAMAPVLNANQQNGKSTVYFNGTSLCRVIANATVEKLRTVIMVNRVASGSHPNPNGGWSNAGILGLLNQDIGLRLLNQTNAKVDSMFEDGILYVNGVSEMVRQGNLDSMPFPNNVFNTLMAVAATDKNVPNLTIGDYFGHPTYQRAYYGDIAEVIAYDRVLTEIERLETERYLAAKWNLRIVPDVSYTNILPTATALTVAEGASLDLAGGYQEVASLSGGGTVSNGGAGRATLVLTSGASVFTGTVTGDVCLEVAAGATLDLGGGTLTVSAVAGSGRIVNGTVIVTGAIYPGGKDTVGTLTFESAPVVNGATLVVDGDLAHGTVDKVAVEAGVFDISGLALSVPRRKDIPMGTHGIVGSDGGVSGAFASTDLPDFLHWNVHYGAKVVQLVCSNGMIIILK